MQERRYRPGDVLDDYCPRERRITDHAIVAMIDDEIRRTRCGICDAEHEYKEGKVPAPRRKTQPPALFNQVLDNINGTPKPQPPAAAEELPVDEPAIEAPVAAAAVMPEPDLEMPPPALDAGSEDVPGGEEEREEGGFRRSLIRATFPRPEGQAPPQRNAPEFTLQSLHNRRNNQRQNGRGRRRPGGGAGFDNIGPMRFRDHGQGQGQNQGGGGRRRRGGKKNR